MTRIFLTIFFVFAAGCSFAQKKIECIHVFTDHNYLSAAPIDLRQSVVIDSAIFVADYTFSYQKEAWNKYRWVDEPMHLQVGRAYTKFTPGVLSEIDEKFTKPLERGNHIEYGAVYPKLCTYYYNPQEQLISSEHRIPFSNKHLIVYDERVQSPEWVIGDGETEILGYRCFKASADFRGRKWVIWFTSDIPANTCVWKFTGLPGLVLKAETDTFRFVCTGIRQQREAIIQPTASMHKRYNREKWRKFEKSYHETPYIFFSENGTHVFYEGKYELTKDNWVIEYNPIELE